MNENTTPKWLNRDEYPFDSNWFELPMGKMHYVDEGEGDSLVFVHGNPGWSYEFRKVIKAVSRTMRCIACDHIGFGLSDKPFEWNYLPSSHADNFEKLMLHLGLDNIILVVNDWGGPIGLSFALKYPEKIKHIIITNTWMWSAENDPYYRKFSSFMGGPIGRFLIRNFNFFGKVVIKKCYADKKNFDSGIYAHLNTRNDRKGCWTFPGQIIGSSRWLEQLWNDKEKLESVPKTLIWGLKDIAFREKEFETWRKSMVFQRIIPLLTSGHYPHEEDSNVIIEEIVRCSEE
ncbi:MAG: alpha/beta fold hydrolase [Deltaproteobacteria bacterium]|nr:alpha/beta fold hydrolase [Deltaproteobacteria bacterium]